MTRILNWLGLMRVSEHERVVADNDDKAYRSWVKLVGERDFYVSEWKALDTKWREEVSERKRVQYDLAQARLEIASLRPDAEAMRRKRQMDRDRRRMGK